MSRLRWCCCVALLCLLCLHYLIVYMIYMRLCLHLCSLQLFSVAARPPGHRKTCRLPHRQERIPLGVGGREGERERGREGGREGGRKGERGRERGRRKREGRRVGGRGEGWREWEGVE